jgi:hypothetical protein
VTSPKQPGRGWAYTGAVLGGLVSVAANVAHSFINPPGAPIGWHPEPGAVVSAIVWPVFLLIAVEILIRIGWPHGISWVLARFVGMLPIIGVAAFVSYRHLSGLLAFYGEEPIVCVIGPLAVDGLMVMATTALMALKVTARNTSTDIAADASAPAIVSAVPAPAAHAVVAAAAPVVSPVDIPAHPAPAVSVPVPDQVVTRPTVAPPAVPSPQTVTPTGREPAAPRPAARSGGSGSASRAMPRTAPTPVTAPAPAPASTTLTPELLARAQHFARQFRDTTGREISPAQLGNRMRVNSETAAKLLTALATHTQTTTPISPVPVAAAQ